MNKHIDEIEFAVFDSETTGLSPDCGDRIIEIAALRFKGNKRIASFSSLVNPERAVSPGAFAVNHISDDMLKDAPLAGEVLPQFFDFVRGACLCSYNAGFDMGFLNNELKLAGLPGLSGVRVIDVLRMARRILPDLKRHPLWFVAEALGITQPQEHRALSDVEITYKVMRKLKSIAKKKGVTDFHSFLSFSGLPAHGSDEIIRSKMCAIQEAIDASVMLEIRYLSSTNSGVSRRRVIPKGIRRVNSAMCMVGHCLLRNEERTFRLDGILHLEILRAKG